MSRTTMTAETTRIHAEWWDPDEWVEIRTYVGAYDADRIEGSGMLLRQKITGAGSGGNMAQAQVDQSFDITTHEQNINRLEACVVDWFLRDGRTKEPLPRPSRLMFQRLHQDDRDYILAQYAAVTAPWKELLPGTPPEEVDAHQEHERTFHENGAEDPQQTEATPTPG